MQNYSYILVSEVLGAKALKHFLNYEQIVQGRYTLNSLILYTHLIKMTLHIFATNGRIHMGFLALR